MATTRRLNQSVWGLKIVRDPAQYATVYAAWKNYWPGYLIRPMRSARSTRYPRFIGSVFAILRTNLRFLRYSIIREISICDSDFSLSVFREKRPVTVFLQFEERQQETTQLWLSSMIAHRFNYFIEHVVRQPVLLMRY